MKIKMFDGVDVTFTEMTARVHSRSMRLYRSMIAGSGIDLGFVAKLKKKHPNKSIEEIENMLTPAELSESESSVKALGKMSITEEYDQLCDMFFERIIISGIGNVLEKYEEFYKKYGFEGEEKLFQESITFYIKNQQTAGEKDNISRPAAAIQG